MDNQEEPRWKREIDEILLEAERKALEERYQHLLPLVQQIRENLGPAVQALKKLAQELKEEQQQNESEETKE